MPRTHSPYDAWQAVVQDRLRESKVFRERLVEVPWDLSFPYWIRDPDFDLQAHLPRVKLASPGGMQKLMGLASSIWGEVLDRERPLWEMTFVEGLDNISGIAEGSYALITRVHHAAVDGKAGGEMMSALMDLSPEIRQMKGEDPWEPEEIPSPNGMPLLNPGPKPVKKAPRTSWFYWQNCLGCSACIHRQAPADARTATPGY